MLTASATTIRRRFQLAATTLALALLIPALGGWWSMTAISTRADNAVLKAVAAQQLSARFVAAAMQAAHSGQSYVMAPSARLEAEFRRKGREAHDIALALSRDATASSRVAGAVARLNGELGQLESHLVRAHRHTDLGEFDAARAALEASTPFRAEMLRAVAQLGGAEAAHLAAATDAMRDASRYQGIVFIGVFATVALMMALIARWLSQTVARPLTRLVAHASAIAEQRGNAHTPVASVPGEFAELAFAMNAATESLARVAKAEAVANQNQRLALVGQLASGVAHELNNPLHTILLTVGLLQEDVADPAVRRELDVVQAQAARAREIVQDLIAATTPRSGLRELVPADSIVRRAHEELTRLAKMHGARLVLDLPSHSLPCIAAERNELTRLLGVLVSNAAYAAGAQGTVTIRADEMDAACRFLVDDDGPGFGDEIMPRLFEPFFTTKPVGQGSGLGLTIALGIVESHHGQITAENRTDKSGASVIVRIPQALPVHSVSQLPEEAAVLTASSPSATDLRVVPDVVGDVVCEAAAVLLAKPRALLVDDEPTVRLVLRRILTRTGWRVDEAPDGAVALALIATAEREGAPYTFILCDLRMPTMSGIALHDVLAEQYPSMLDVLTIASGDLTSPDVAAFVSRTACPVLAKPLEMKEFLRVAADARLGVSCGATACR